MSTQPLPPGPQPPIPPPAPAPTTSWWPPHRKVSASGAAGAICTIGAWLLSTYANVNPPPEVVAGAVFLVMTAVAYLVPGAE